AVATASAEALAVSAQDTFAEDVPVLAVPAALETAASTALATTLEDTAPDESDDTEPARSPSQKTLRKKALKKKILTSEQLRDLLNAALSSYHAGDWETCKAQCTTFLTATTRIPEVYHILSHIHRREREFFKAEAAIRKALALAPTNAGYWNSAGLLSADQKHYRKAESRYTQALSLNPTLAPAWNDLGNTLMALERDDEAADAFARAKDADPHFVPLYANLCGLYLKKGKLVEAVKIARAGLDLDANQPALWSNYGSLLVDMGIPREAEKAYERALELDWDMADVHFNLGNVLYAALHRPGKAYAHFKRALELRPDNAPAMGNLAQVLIGFQRTPEALELLKKARELDPHNDALLLTLVSGYRMAKENRLEALDIVEKVLGRQPDSVGAIGLKGGLLSDLGRLEEGLDWQERAFDLEPTNAHMLSNLLFTKNYLCRETPQALLEAACTYGTLVAPEDDDGNKLEPVCTVEDRDPDRPLRIGFVSGDLHNHPIGYFMEGVLPALTTSRNTYYLYQTQRGEDDLTLRLKACKHQWRDVFDLDDHDLYEKIVEDKIDILIDLSGHSGYHRLPMFAMRPAPVQATWFGIASTTGLRTIDYFLCDRNMVPPEEGAFLSETPCYLPSGYFSFKAPEPAVPVVNELPAQRNGYVTFGTFNNPNKIIDKVIEVWSRILAAVPDSRLMLKAGVYTDDVYVANTRERFARYGVTGDRLILEGPSPRLELLATYNKLDIALDPFPYVGGCTTAEALWMGVPVLTRQGFHALSRLGESLMHAMDMPEWIAANDDEYVAKAVTLASDIPALAALHQSLRERFLRSPLGDGQLFAQGLEQAFRGMWQTWVQEKKEY
ncbi:MAG: tetratricopeptide repeat protein, partial [Bilophila sp.]